jgi:K+-transporting ATPase ATPase B chain
MPDALRKLDPRTLWKNPVMFIVEVGAVFTTVLAIASSSTFSWLIVVWLWLTVLFANLAEAVAEGRGKAQADALRRAKTDTIARRLVDPALLDGAEEPVPAPELRPGDRVVCEAGDVIPGDGDVIDGVASVDESAITGESAPVIRESGGDRSSVTGGTRVLSDRIVVEITQKPGESFIDRMIALVEGARRQKTPNEIALNFLLASLTIIFPAGHRDPPADGDLRQGEPTGHRQFGRAGQQWHHRHRHRPAARLSHPNHDRRVAISDRYRRYGPARAAQCASHEWTSRGSRGRRQHTIAR